MWATSELAKLPEGSFPGRVASSAWRATVRQVPLFSLASSSSPRPSVLQSWLGRVPPSALRSHHCDFLPQSRIEPFFWLRRNRGESVGAHARRPQTAKPAPSVTAEASAFAQRQGQGVDPPTVGVGAEPRGVFWGKRFCAIVRMPGATNAAEERCGLVAASTPTTSSELQAADPGALESHRHMLIRTETERPGEQVRRTRRGRMV